MNVVVNFPNKQEVDLEEDYHLSKDEALEELAENSGSIDAMIFLGIMNDGKLTVSKFMRNQDDVLKILGALEVLKMSMVKLDHEA